MVYVKQATPSRGQGYRDMIRCESLERRGYRVDTLDNKHKSTHGKLGEIYSLNHLHFISHFRFIFGSHRKTLLCKFYRIQKNDESNEEDLDHQRNRSRV